MPFPSAPPPATDSQVANYGLPHTDGGCAQDQSPLKRPTDSRRPQHDNQPRDEEEDHHHHAHLPHTTSSSASSSSTCEHPSSPPRTPPSTTRPTHSKASPTRRRSLRLHVGVLSKHKGVRYNADGSVVVCRFCEILRKRDEPFLYEDDDVVVFRPLRPIVPSHILIVPRAHIRNVNQLTMDHLELVRRMRHVAETILDKLPAHIDTDGHNSGFDHKSARHGATNTRPAAEDAAPCHHGDCQFAFHVPPFNSIDHVHMHAFRGETGYFGRIKYRTNSWWCRSYDEVVTRLQHEDSQPATYVDASSR